MAKNRKQYFEGVTKTGFRYHVERDVIDDMELIDLLADLEDGSISALPKILVKLLGEKQKRALYDHCKDKMSSRIPSSKVMSEIQDIMTNPNLKKS
ncbi:hypothetical protein J2Z60_000176 [Lactobacillus colini]|uniref:Phage protein n=1 Tax=Lactobacillus colini TaxID=1819254 RepID=A0ABS4MBH4_9LACO|nr:hypothetical protein [Lactobacillus colini]MBP2057014.1 hypothetical protein [Lactobacillus colini]